MTQGLSKTQIKARKDLRRAVFDCRERALYEAAAWAAQQLAGLPEETVPLEPGEVRPGGEEESDSYLLAKSYFDLKVIQPMLKCECGPAVNQTMQAGGCNCQAWGKVKSTKFSGVPKMRARSSLYIIRS